MLDQIFPARNLINEFSGGPRRVIWDGSGHLSAVVFSLDQEDSPLRELKRHTSAMVFLPIFRFVDSQGRILCRIAEAVPTLACSMLTSKMGVVF